MRLEFIFNCQGKISYVTTICYFSDGNRKKQKIFAVIYLKGHL